MAMVTAFEDLQAWQKARELTRAVYRSTKGPRFADDDGLRKQMRESAVSVMANIAEGFERGGSAEFKQFLSIAKGSAGEVESHLYVALDEEYISQNAFDELRFLARSVRRLIGGLIRYLKSSSLRGSKFKSDRP
jgi:four helix bundle protein